MIDLLLGVLLAEASAAGEPCATSCGRPMASSTWLGSSEPEVQALPEEAQMPASSSRRRRLSPSMPSKQKFTLPGRRCVRSPLSAACGIWSSPAMSLSRRARDIRRVFLDDARTPRASAAAMPTMPAMFSVPARLPRSCAPPSMTFVRGMPRRAYSTPTPFGPWNLWRGKGEHIDVLRLYVDGRDGPPPAPRPCGRGRPSRGRPRRSPRWAGWCRSRCWRT